MKKITPEESMKDLKARKHTTPVNTAAKMLKKYKAFRNKLVKARMNGWVDENTPDLPLAVTFNKKAIIALTKLPGFTGLRITPAINADNMLTFILSGIDANGEAITPDNEMGKPGGTVTDEGQINPPFA
jgi:hypothetical protein